MKYKITIHLINKSDLVFTSRAPYFNYVGKTDQVAFGTKTITIESERPKLYQENDVFMNVQNSLYNQILKCLQIHYCNEGFNAGISQIQVESKKGNGYDCLFTRVFDTNFQPYPAFDAPISFKTDVLKQLLQEDDDSYTLRTIISHWLSQGQTKDNQRKLECVWRTFEQICNHMRHVTMRKRSNIADGLDKLVIELTSNPTPYNYSAGVVSKETQNTLRELRWREMIENNYPKGSNNQTNYEKYKKRLIDPYIDERVCTLMKEVLVYRQNELCNYGLYVSIENDLNNKIDQHIKKDIDIVAILCYYAYYLRNRLFHGQTLLRSSIFDKNKNEEMGVHKLSHLLSVLTVELINNYSLL